MGAVDYIAKPMVGLTDGFDALRDEIVAKVKAAAHRLVSDLRRRVIPRRKSRPCGPRLTPDTVPRKS